MGDRSLRHALSVLPAVPFLCVCVCMPSIGRQFTPTGQGPGEICGHSAVIDPSNDRFIYVYGGMRRKATALDPGMYVLDTQQLHWTYVPAPRGDYNNPESLFLDHPVQDAIVPPSRRNHGAFFLDKKMVIYGG